MKRSRTTNSLFNFITGIGGYLLITVIEFIVRTVFIHKLGKVYLGLNGLFSNVLTMLSLAELGVGDAILFKLYKPLAEDDKHRIALLMKFYRRAYAMIGGLIAVIGICIIPLLPTLINNYDKYTGLQTNLTLVYILFLSRTVSSYLFFAYKSAIIKANQQEYIVNIITFIFTIASSVVRIIALYCWPRFEIYVIISVASTILQNLIIALRSNKLFPFLRKVPNESLDKEDQRRIFKDCGALMIYKINAVMLKGTDNLIISAFLGLEQLGLYTNYYLFHKTMNAIIGRTFNSITHSLGNLHANANTSKEYEIFRQVQLIAAILAGVVFVGIGTVGDAFIQSWIGSDWIFDSPVAIMIGLELYTLAIRAFLSRYRTSMGLFQQAKFRPLIGALVNLVVSLIMVRYWGVCGVLFGTVVADWTTCMSYDPIVIHKYGFKDTTLIKGYYLRFGKYFITAVIMLIINKWISSVLIPNHGWLSVIVHALICVFSTLSAMLLVSWKTTERKQILEIAIRIYRKVHNRIIR